MFQLTTWHPKYARPFLRCYLASGWLEMQLLQPESDCLHEISDLWRWHWYRKEFLQTTPAAKQDVNINNVNMTSPCFCSNQLVIRRTKRWDEGRPVAGRSVSRDEQLWSAEGAWEADVSQVTPIKWAVLVMWKLRCLWKMLRPVSMCFQDESTEIRVTCGLGDFMILMYLYVMLISNFTWCSHPVLFVACDITSRVP